MNTSNMKHLTLSQDNKHIVIKRKYLVTVKKCDTDLFLFFWLGSNELPYKSDVQLEKTS